ncbi:MAG: hypothetical protein CMJ64_07975, partial [Planctomycetaceae bacterium]|nr:hypothetical protein [Planctomycetaceae bacterium]
SGTSTAASLDLDSTGTITDDGTMDLTVTGNADFNAAAGASAITLADNAADVLSVGGNASFTGSTIDVGPAGMANFATLTFSSAGAVTIQEDSSTEITGTNTAASLDLDSAGAITDAAGTSLTVTGLADFAGGAITLGDSGGDTTNFGSLTFISTGAVDITEDSSMLVNTSSATGAITLAVTDTAAATDDFTLAAGAMLTSTGSTIQLDIGDDVDIPAGTTVMAAGTFTINVDAPGSDADAGVGSTVDLNGTITAASTAITGGDDNDAFNIATVPMTLDGITGDVTVAGGGNGISTRDVFTGADVGHPFGCPATPGPLTILGPATVDEGDTLTISDASEPTAHTYAIDGDSVTRDGGLAINYSAIEELELFAGAANDTVEVDMAAAGALPSVVAFDGGGQIGVGVNAGDMFKVFGTAAADNMIIGVITADPGPRSPFEVADVEFIKARGLDGNDDIINDTMARSLLEGMGGDDILVGGSDIDIIVGGGGQDYLDGRGGNDFLFADVNFLSTSSGTIIADDAVGEGDFLDGGPGIDSAAQSGPCDRIDNIEGLLLDGGGQKNVITWLRAQIAVLSSANVDALIATAFAALEFDWGLQTQTAEAVEPDPATVADSMQQLAIQLDDDSGLSSDGNMYEDWGGLGEKWIKGSGGDWYYITPAGELFLWHGGDVHNATIVATLSPEYHAKPELLYDAAEYATTQTETTQQQESQVETQEAGTDANEGEAAANSQTSELAQLDQQYGFHFAGSYYTNWGGKNEKWIQDQQSRWFFLLPNGELYQWDSGAGATGTLVASLSTDVYDDPALLHDAPIDATTNLTAETGDTESGNTESGDTGNDSSDAEVDPLVELQSQYGFAFTGNFHENWGGLGEKWFKDNTGAWYFIQPNGEIYHWSGGTTSDGELIAQVDSAVHADPTLLFNASANSSAGNGGASAETQDSQSASASNESETSGDASASTQNTDPLAELDAQYGFSFAGTYYEDWGHRDEKWIKDANEQWYFILPNGELYLWDGSQQVTGTIIANVGSAVHTNPSNLFDAA